MEEVDADVACNSGGIVNSEASLMLFAANTLPRLVSCVCQGECVSIRLDFS